MFRIDGEDRAGVERLLRYCARPPFALERLWAPGGIVSLASPESRLVYRLPTKGGVPKPTPDGRTQLLSPGPKSSTDPEPAPPSNPARIRWATLLARIYGVLPLLCPACGRQMSILAFLTDPPPISSARLGRPWAAPNGSGPARRRPAERALAHPGPALVEIVTDAQLV